MPSTESGTTRSEIHRTFSIRLTELAQLGVHDLIFERGKPAEIGADKLTVTSEFLGEPNVIIVASRSKQGKGILYREDIILRLDGNDLVIYGAQQVFSGKIPADKTTRNKVIGEAIAEAFNNPKRITEFSPSYWTTYKSSHYSPTF